MRITIHQGPGPTAYMQLSSIAICAVSSLLATLLVGLPSVTTAQSDRNAIIHTSEGDISIMLYASKAPKAVNNFIGLSTGEKSWTDPTNGETVEGRPLYNGTIFHRVISGFVIQGGDPLGTGAGGPGYQFEDEFSDLLYDQSGRVGMANSGPNTNGCQFFITTAATPILNNKNTIFGQVTSGMSVVNSISNKPVAANYLPLTPIYIDYIEIVSDSSVDEWQLY